MIDDDIYTFHLDAFTPATIPMVRLAEYMAALAKLFGHSERVHFDGLREGSTQVLARVEREAAPKVRTHLQSAIAGAEVISLKEYKALNDMLRADNASAELLLATAKVLTFPGRKQPRPEKIGPFRQDVAVEGVLVRIGGKDKTAHAMLEDSEGATHSFEVSRDIAREIAPFLFGQPIRIYGSGRWCRNEDGEWEVSGLSGTGFERLADEGLDETIARVRGITRPLGERDAMRTLRELRDDSDGVH